MSAWPFARLANWFETQSRRPDLSLADQVMLENVSAWLRNQDRGTAFTERRQDPWVGLSNE